MSIRSLVKSVAFAALGSPAVAAMRLRQIARSDVLTVLNLHRVAPYDGSTYPPLDPQLFRDLLSFCTAHFEVTTFGEAGARQSGKPQLIFSFDDGYKDFADYAAPILGEFGLRCNQNVIPQVIASGLPPFNVVLNDFAGMASEDLLEKCEFPGFRRYSRAEGRYAWGNALSHWFKCRPMADQQKLAKQLAPQLGIGTEFVPTPMMSLAEVREIAAVHEIGAHSFEHASLKYESDAYVSEDARRCRIWFREQLNSETQIYALPNGEYREAQLDLIEAEGYSTILLVGSRFTKPQERRPYRFNFDAASQSEMRFKALGGIASITAN
jgi:peptidoglycan/xylan/chitin deacetylase (PgdA/CDA1 family)